MRISDWSSDVCSSDLPRKDVCRHDKSSARHSYATPLEQFTENRINFAPVMHLAHDEAPVEIAHRFISPPKITACGEHSPRKPNSFPGDHHISAKFHHRDSSILHQQERLGICTRNIVPGRC